MQLFLSTLKTATFLPPITRTLFTQLASPQAKWTVGDEEVQGVTFTTPHSSWWQVTPPLSIAGLACLHSPWGQAEPTPDNHMRAAKHFTPILLRRVTWSEWNISHRLSMNDRLVCGTLKLLRWCVVGRYFLNHFLGNIFYSFRKCILPTLSPLECHQNIYHSENKSWSSSLQLNNTPGHDALLCISVRGKRPSLDVRMIMVSSSSSCTSFASDKSKSLSMERQGGPCAYMVRGGLRVIGNGQQITHHLLSYDMALVEPLFVITLHIIKKCIIETNSI